MRRSVQAAAIAVAIGLAGCATQPEIPFDKTTGSDIKVIGVVTPDMPGKPTVWLASDVGQSFGLVGALVDAGLQSSRDSKFWTMMTNANFNPQSAFIDALQKSLTAHGFTAKLVPIDKRDSGYLKQYPPVGPDKVDAYLDTSFIGTGYGYVAAGIGSSTPYRPFIYLNCRLVRASDSSVLMQDTILYDPINAGTKIVTISPDPAYTFTDFDAMEADPKNAVAGVDKSFNTTADTLAGLLK
jgi:hypothetical protein